MSDAESLNSGDSDLNVTAPKILDAVKSYLMDKSFDANPKSRPSDFSAKDSGYIRRLSDRNAPIHSGVVTPAIEASIDVGEPHIGILRENNQELLYIRNILSKSIPDALNETLLLVVEERSRRERIEAELEAVREKWRQDVSEFRKIIDAKSQTIHHLIRLNSTVSNSDSDSQLQAALSEIDRLHTLIRTIR